MRVKDQVVMYVPEVKTLVDAAREEMQDPTRLAYWSAKTRSSCATCNRITILGLQAFIGIIASAFLLTGIAVLINTWMHGDPRGGVKIGIIFLAGTMVFATYFAQHRLLDGIGVPIKRPRWLSLLAINTFPLTLPMWFLERREHRQIHRGTTTAARFTAMKVAALHTAHASRDATENMLKAQLAGLASARERTMVRLAHAETRRQQPVQPDHAQAVAIRDEVSEFLALLESIEKDSARVSASINDWNECFAKIELEVIDTIDAEQLKHMARMNREYTPALRIV
ncbi:MAG: hypothetical protein ABIG71_02820 [Candidatus Uhrbacteria bacterium]